jgi:hypothetical protein
MTATLHPTPGRDGHHADDEPAPSRAAADPGAATRRARWPIFGVVAGVSALAATVASMPTISEEEARTGADVVDQLERGGYHVGFVLGLISVGCLFVVSSAWKRWAEARAPRDLAARTIGQGLVATATVNIIFTCITGAMALYLPGGTDEGWLSKDALFVDHTLLDFGSLLGWWGAAVAAACVATLSLRKDRLLPRWMGVASVVLLAPPVLLALGTALPGFVGLTMPIWLVAISLGMVFSPTADATA